MRELRVVPDVFAYYAWKNVTIGVYVGQLTVPAVHRLLDMSSEIARAYPSGRSSVVFVLDQLPGPTLEAQKEMKRIYEIEGLKCTATILEGTGFWASAIRSMTANLHRAADTGMTVRVNTSLEEVLAWLPQVHARATAIALPVEEFRIALRYAREKGAARALAKAVE